MAKRVVFDTNVLISGFLWRGKAYQCLLLARSGVVQALYCSETLAELSDKLRKPFKFSENYVHAVIYDVRRFAELVKIEGTLHAIDADPDDDKFVECAVVSQAGVIVSGDRHLLNLGDYQGIKVLNTEEFLEWVTHQ